ncbi:MAG: hypothetical protein BTN85_0394 [Candidatus Methanohalarchaeum thermophilum]|uniref:Uncharacterized protein n=1 Tax=Methanohalarchaeum thermophilum TaxID=1903181 RepID=A0A1Q6DUA3_METT1|nr:MAG: hypothetical protein BTN85_0394 [Candidatus Methanohalarchaeum thermophilum]
MNKPHPLLDHKTINEYGISSQSLSYNCDADLAEESREQLQKHFEIHKSIYDKVLQILNGSDGWIGRYEVYSRLQEWKKTLNPEPEFVLEGWLAGNWKSV